ncbi:MAG: carbohydrate kinase family protein [Spirochaetota bacterium]
MQRITILTFRGSSNNLSLDELCVPNSKSLWLYGASMVGRSLETQKKLFTLAKNDTNRIKTAYSPSSYVCKMGFNLLKPILSNTDVLIVNKEGAQHLVYKGELINLAKLLAEYGPKIVTVSDGLNGVAVYARDSGEKLHITPAFDLNIIDTTGAGDAFGSGFIAGLIMKKTIEQAALIGVLNAEYVIQNVGATKGIPNREIMERILANPQEKIRHHISYL